MAKSPSPSGVLAQLLTESFSGQELRRFVRGGPETDIISDELPGEAASPSKFAYATVDALLRHGLLDDVFFDRLIELRPRREGDVRRVQALFLTTSRGVVGGPTSSDASPGQSGTSTFRTHGWNENSPKR